MFLEGRLVKHVGRASPIDEHLINLLIGYDRSDDYWIILIGVVHIKILVHKGLGEIEVATNSPNW